MTSALYSCGECGEALSEAREPCSRCGSTRRDVSLTLEGAIVFGQAGQLGLMAESPAANDRPHRIQVRTPLGASSTVELYHDGTVQLNASGPPDVGTRGETQVRDILIERLVRDGWIAKQIAGARNDRGEDGLLQLDGNQFALQITAIPPSATFWGQSAASSANTTVHVDHAAHWIHYALLSKAGLSSKHATIVAIDARHVGIAVDPRVVASYNSQYPHVNEQFGFHSVWLVGPTPSHCTLLGCLD